MRNARAIRAKRAESLMRPTGTPRPRDVTASRQVSWLTAPRPCLAFPVQGTSDRSRQQLTAYSCGGSSGIDPCGCTGFPLSSRSRNRETSNAACIGLAAKLVNAVNVNPNKSYRFTERSKRSVGFMPQNCFRPRGNFLEF